MTCFHPVSPRLRVTVESAEESECCDNLSEHDAFIEAKIYSPIAYRQVYWGPKPMNFSSRTVINYYGFTTTLLKRCPTFTYLKRRSASSSVPTAWCRLAPRCTSIIILGQLAASHELTSTSSACLLVNDKTWELFSNDELIDHSAATNLLFSWLFIITHV